MPFSIKYDTIIKSSDSLGINNYLPSFDQTEQALNAAPSWLFFLFLSILSIYIFVRTYYGVHFRYITMGLVLPRKTQLLLRESSFFNRAPFLLFFLNYLILLALFITLFFYKNQLQNQGLFLHTLKIVLLLFALFVIRWLIIRFIGKLFKVENAISIYLQTTHLFQVAAGIILFPLLIIYIYSPSWIAGITENIILIWIAAIFTFGIIKGLTQIIVQLSFSYFHIIFYLCTVEIASIFIVLNFRNWLFISHFF